MADLAPFVSFFHQSHAGVGVSRPFLIPSQLKRGVSAKGGGDAAGGAPPHPGSVHPSVHPRVLLPSTSAFLKPGVSLYVTKLGFFLPEFPQAGNFVPNRSREITPEPGACWRQEERRGAGRPRRTSPYFQSVFQVLCSGHCRSARAAASSSGSTGGTGSVLREDERARGARVGGWEMIKAKVWALRWPEELAPSLVPLVAAVPCPEHL